MNFTKLVPNIFYTDIKTGLKMFVDCLEFKIAYSELHTSHQFCVVEKDGLRINLFQSQEYADQHKPEFRLVTENIVEVYQKVKSGYPEFLHPNLNVVTRRPWGAQEFALRDEQICMVIQQW